MPDERDEATNLEESLGEETLTRPGPHRNLDTILRIPVVVQVVLGSAVMPVSNLLKLGRGAVIPLDHRLASRSTSSSMDGLLRAAKSWWSRTITPDLACR
jgi:flagellar motor switch/type III secretory pathway protein FliN